MDRFHSAAVSAFCSLMLGSAFMGSSAGPRLAGLAAGALAGEVKTLSAAGWEAVSDVSVANALADIPSAAPANASLKSVDTGMAAVRDAVLKSDTEGSLPGFLCTLLGLTQNDQPLQVKQKSAKEGDLDEVAFLGALLLDLEGLVGEAALGVLKSDTEGSLPGFLCTLLGLTQNDQPLQVKQKSAKEGDLIQVANVSLKTREDMIIGHRTAESAVLYRTDSSGSLIKAASFKKGQGGSEIPLADAQAGFDAARAYWVARLGAAVASTP